MAFITEQDYSAVIRDEVKNILIEDNGLTKLSSAEDMAIAQVKNYLSGTYDTSAIFGATGTDRNSHIVMIVIDCTLYHLYTSIAPDQIPKIRSERYGDAIDWLKSIANGDISADLPSKQSGDISTLKITSKYNPKQNKW